MELIQKTISIATLVFVLSSMLATGLGLTVSEIIIPLRNTGWSCYPCWQILC